MAPGPTWIVVPTYDEAGSLPALVRGLLAHDVRVLVVDDASPDGTGRIADALAAADPRVEVLHRPHKAGLAAAYVAGFAHALAAGAGHVLQMDGDGSHDPADVPRLLAAAGAGADVVLGSRYVPGGRVEHWGVGRRALSRAACAYARWVLRAPVRDLTGGFKCFTAEALAVIDPARARSEGYAFQVELTQRALRRGLRVREIPIVFSERRAGRSKLSRAIALEAVWRIPSLYFLK